MPLLIHDARVLSMPMGREPARGAAMRELGAIDRGWVLVGDDGLVHVKRAGGNDWSNVAPEDERLKIAITRILRLRLAGLTVGAVGADFLRRRIAPCKRGGGPPRNSRTRRTS